MLGSAARHQVQETLQLDEAHRGENYRPGDLSVRHPPRARRLSHRKVLLYYVPLALAAIATVVLSLVAAMSPMTTTNTALLAASVPFSVTVPYGPSMAVAQAYCHGEDQQLRRDANAFMSSATLRLRMTEPDDIAFSIGAPYQATNCTIYTVHDFDTAYLNPGVLEGFMYYLQFLIPDLIIVVERKGRAGVTFATADIVFVKYGSESTFIDTFDYVDFTYETYNTFVKPPHIHSRRVVTSPISTWHSLAELTTMIALAISGCLFAFAWSQVKELDVIHELEQTTSNAVTLTASDQYSVLGTAFDDTEELVENPYGTSMYTKPECLENTGTANERKGPQSRTHSHADMDTRNGYFSDDGSERGSPVEGRESPLAAPQQPCRPPSPLPVSEQQADGPNAECAAASSLTVGMRTTTSATDAGRLTVGMQQDGREAGDTPSETAVFMHEPSNLTPVRAIPISRTRITRMRRLRDLIRQYQLARVRQLALLDCVLLIVSFFLFLNTFAWSSSEEVSHSASRGRRVIVAQSTYVVLRTLCCVLSVFTFLVTVLIVKFDIW